MRCIANGTQILKADGELSVVLQWRNDAFLLWSWTPWNEL